MIIDNQETSGKDMLLSEPSIQAQAPDYVFHIYDYDLNHNLGIKNNTIDQAKYNVFTFFPKALIFQFFRIANVYFLFIVIIQCFGILSPLIPISVIIPFVVVILFSIGREGVEDLKRHRFDEILNSEEVLVYRDGSWKEDISGNLHIGELVITKMDRTFAADMILLDSERKEGVCYIETASLDGEKSLKIKSAVKASIGIFVENQEFFTKKTVSGTVKCEQPNANLSKYEGNVKLIIKENQSSEKVIELNTCNKQLLLKGAILRNTDWVIGLVTYTGNNNKMIKNSQRQKNKLSRVEWLLSYLLISIFILQLILCLAASVGYKLFYTDDVRAYIPPHPVYNEDMMTFLTFFSYIILLNTMIPISLIVTVEIVKLIQGGLMAADAGMFSLVRRKLLKVGAVTLNEELGQVNFIFTDKTGTLTCNKMEFKFCVIGDNFYEYDKGMEVQMKRTNSFNERRSSLHIKTNDSHKFSKSTMLKYLDFNEDLYPEYTVKSAINDSVFIKLNTVGGIVREYWKALSLCHECVREKPYHKDGEDIYHYSGLSPDDIELVTTAKDIGFVLTDTSLNTRKLKINTEEEVTYEVLECIEFSSVRKRMSIIIKDGDIIKLYIKGADNVIKERLGTNTKESFLETSNDYVAKFSSMGYRTLLVGMKVIDVAEYEEWKKRLDEASKNLKTKEAMHDALYNEIENNITLLGATFVEDKLQDEVPETIRDLRMAGIRVWMLTGDKLNTAVDTALSCNLLSKETPTIIIDSICNFEVKVKEIMSDFMDKTDYSMVIECSILPHIFEDEKKKQDFFTVAEKSLSVVCCRASPGQKRDLVFYMKEHNKNITTLSIGDGGNDVSMITEAHLGIGVYGEEGMNAVQAADFAIGEFKLLRRLLFYHGRTNYIRISDLIPYFFYKNFVFTILHFYYAFLNLCSGQTLLDSLMITFYNLLFTAYPSGGRGTMEFDVKPDDGENIDKLLPFLYKETRNNPRFTFLKSFSYIGLGFFHCLIIFFFTFFSFNQSASNQNGDLADIWYLSIEIYTSLIVIVTFNLFINTLYWTFISWLLPLILTFLPYAIFLYGTASVANINSGSTIFTAASSLRFWLVLILSSGFSFFVDLAIKEIPYYFNTSLSHEAMLYVKKIGIGNANNYQDLPKRLKECIDEYYPHLYEKVGLEQDELKNNKNTNKSAVSSTNSKAEIPQNHLLILLHKEREKNEKNE